jgi:ADP-glucose pyrophosphorylase
MLLRAKHVIIHNEAEDFVGKHKRSNVTCVINSLRVEYEELSRYENADSSWVIINFHAIVRI